MVSGHRWMVGALCAVLLAVFLPVTGWPGDAPHPIATRQTVIALDDVSLSSGRGRQAGFVGTDGPGLPVAAQTGALSTDEFDLVGLTWDAAPDEDSIVSVRLRAEGQWTGWTQVPFSVEHGPDPGSDERAGARHGSDPLLTGTSDGIQVRIKTPDGVAPANTDIHLVSSDPGDIQRSSLASAAAASGMPEIITRAQWGADESKRNRDPVYSKAVKVGFVHHTASASDYSAEQAAGEVRSLYAWYTDSLKYSDMAYNFLVDRFGRLYEGRAGGMDRPVIGGHTAGLNTDSFAVSAIGNFDTFDPAAADMSNIKESIARLMAWKLGLTKRDPGGTDTLVSNGSLNSGYWEAGEVATLKRVSGHRDAGNTACPGKFLYAQVGDIRARAAALFKSGPEDLPGLVTAEPVTKEFVFRGAGEGDGVGVPKAGVLGQAREGRQAAGILRHYLTGVETRPVPDASIVAVSLSNGRPSLRLATSALSKTGGGVQVGPGRKAFVGGPTSRLQARADGSVVSVAVRSGRGKKATWRTVAAGPTIKVRWAGTRRPGRAGTGATVLSVGADRLRHGILRLTADDSALHATALLRVHDEYLPFVQEVPTDWPAQAQRAIAVALRSRALAARPNPACDCRFGDGPGSVPGPRFLGYSAVRVKGYSAWRNAVTSTSTGPDRGLAVVVGREPVPVPLFGSTGGATLNGEDVWDSPTPWARSVDDPWSLQKGNNPQYAAWSPQIRAQGAVAAAFGLPDVQSIDFSDRVAGGAVGSAVATAADGRTARLTGEQVRVALSLPSAFIARQVSPLPAAPTSLATALTGGRSGPPVVTAEADPAVVALAARYAAATGRPLLVSAPGTLSKAVTQRLPAGKKSKPAVTLVGKASDALVRGLLRRSRVARIEAPTLADLSLRLAKADGRQSGSLYVTSAGDRSAVVAASATAARAGGDVLVVGKKLNQAASQFAKSARRTVVVAPKRQIPNALAATFRKAVRLRSESLTARLVRLGGLGATPESAIIVGQNSLRQAAVAVASARLVLAVDTAATPSVNRYLQRRPRISTLQPVGRPGPAVAAASHA